MEARFFPSGTFAAVGAPPPDEFAAAAARGDRPLHDPPLPPRDEAVFLLTAVAEIEHALMVQYLYAAYSIKVPDPESVQQGLRDQLIEIAREEMGHLITVQNLLLLVGGPLNLGRDSGPYGSVIYPFQFRLEPLTRDSLAKYVTAESPDPLPERLSVRTRPLPGAPHVLSTLTTEDRELITRLRWTAQAANGDVPVRQIGALFQRLLTLFREMDKDDFRTDTARRQARWADWGYDTLDETQGELIVDRFVDPNARPGVEPGVETLRAAAIESLKKISEQGEGVDLGKGRAESHFERFFAIYKTADGLLARGVRLTWPITSDPNTSVDPDPHVIVDRAVETAAADSRIREPRARAWAQMFNLRYRMLLGQLAHFLHLDQELYVDTPGPELGDRTARGLLLLGAFDEMRHLSKIAAKLVTLPKDTDPASTVHAAPPFEMPYTLNLPDGEHARWRMHRDVVRAAVELAGADAFQGEDDPFFQALTSSDRSMEKTLGKLAAGEKIPSDALPKGFAKVVTILDEAVRGFRVAPQRCPHDDFWSDVTRDEFVHSTKPDVPPIALDPGGNVVRGPEKSEIIRRMKGAEKDHMTGKVRRTDEQRNAGEHCRTGERRRMPLRRPPVPDTRLNYLKQWIAEGAPDDQPPGRKGMTTEPEPATEPVRNADAPAEPPP